MVLSNFMSKELLDNVALEKNMLIFASFLFKNISHVENALKRMVLVKDKSMQSSERHVSEVILVCNPKAKFKVRSSFDSGIWG